MQDIEIDWSFTADPEIMHCIDRAARKALDKFQSYIPFTRDALGEARTDLNVYLATHPNVIEKFREDGNVGIFIHTMYRHGLREKFIKIANETRMDGSLEDPDKNDYLIEKLISDPHLTSARADSEFRYTEEDVKRLAVLSWFPERLMSNRDPFGEKNADLAFDRKSKGNQAHRGDEVAELVDMQNVLLIEDGNRVINNLAELTDREIDILFLCAVQDMTYEAVGLEIGIGKGSVHKNLANTLKRLTNKINNPKGA